jgi:hypothetical protein
MYNTKNSIERGEGGNILIQQNNMSLYTTSGGHTTDKRDDYSVTSIGGGRKAVVEEMHYI